MCSAGIFELKSLVFSRRLPATQADLTALAELREAVSEACSTLGQEVRAILPGEREIWGTATAIDEQARLVLQTVDGRTETISAGDIVHLRTPRGDN
jgi:biotin-(acetyl-CoA carboxylase) ligase